MPIPSEEKTKAESINLRSIEGSTPLVSAVIENGYIDNELQNQMAYTSSAFRWLHIGYGANYHFPPELSASTIFMSYAIHTIQ